MTKFFHYQDNKEASVNSSRRKTGKLMMALKGKKQFASADRETHFWHACKLISFMFLAQKINFRFFSDLSISYYIGGTFFPRFWKVGKVLHINLLSHFCFTKLWGLKHKCSQNIQDWILKKKEVAFTSMIWSFLGYWVKLLSAKVINFDRNLVSSGFKYHTKNQPWKMTCPWPAFPQKRVTEEKSTIRKLIQQQISKSSLL